ncbi:pilus assembly protein TadG-related protein [Leekyejoonella antrihumi]|uniref:Pilus assembly protein n=1 Tax=Leekyejoonella antrihumi TaxID=1660198 RepID=A0A563DU54_9MICO|nr:TadE/TadG family type IV pilus assembly protein [Leekyejoonella antrihumi]TWP33719.1 pilus assembly protein [Leekyejoonella antrihumi]
MLRLTSLFGSRTPRSREQGAIAIMAAIFLSLTVAGIGALAIDTGVLYTERQQAQNGADAAALSVAQSCATSSAGCTATSGNPSAWAQGNADPSMAGIGVTSVCGTAAGLTSCGAGDTAKLPDCPTLPNPAPTNYVEVHTAANNSVHAFILHGNEHPEACSRVAWGSPSSIVATVPFTIGLCQWNTETGNGTNFAGTSDVAIQLNVMDAGCGVTIPGGFGWLDTTGCTALITVGGNVGSNPGNGKGHSCDTEVSPLVGSVVYVPVYDAANGNGQNATFHIAGLAAFHLDGIKAPSFKYSGSAPNNTSSPNCPGNACIWGYFVKALAPVGTIGSGSPNLGLSVLQMVG